MKSGEIMRKSMAVAVATVATAWNAAATDYWVDRARPNDSGDGLSEATAKRTIQAAVDLAGSGDTVWVKPGDYDEGGNAVVAINNQTNRVNIIDKSNLTIKSTGGKAVTRIVGRYGTTADSNLGTDAIRCVFVSGGTGGIRIEGFTFLNGATGLDDARATPITSGGAFYGWNASSGLHYEYNILADCDFIGCRAVYGGVASYATLVRCRVMGCSARSHGSAVYRGALLNCQVNQNTGGYDMVREATCYNCTFADNSFTKGVANNLTLVNCVILANKDGAVGVGGSNLIARYGVFSADNGADFSSKYECNCSPSAAYQFVAPLYDDYRPLNTSDLAGAGRGEELANFGYVTGDELYLDLDRRPIARTGAIAAGCHQKVVTPEGGAVTATDALDYTTRGAAPKTGGLYAFAEHWPTQFLVQGVSTTKKRTVYFTIGGETIYPLLDDSAWITPPESGTVSFKVTSTENIRYVNKATGRDNDASYDGKTPEKPYRTIQRGVDDVPNLVVVAAGDYDEGCRLNSNGGATSNRLVIAIAGSSGRDMRIVGAGAGCTTIRGKAATYDLSADNPGCGPDAIRCIYAGHSCCIQGFTIADGRVVAGNVNGDTNGGGVFGGYNQVVRILDCVFTNCAAFRGDAVHGGDCRRCKFIDCGTGYGHLSRYATFAFCSFAGINCKSTDAFGDDLASYNCTYAGRSTADGMFKNAVQPRYGCVITKANQIKSTLPLEGCVLFGCANVAATEGFVVGDPYYIDEEARDCRVMSCSAAIGAGVMYENASQIMIGDVDGNPIRFTDGRPMAGAYQSFVPGLRVTASDTYGWQSWSGSRELVPGETITVTATDDGTTRHCAGFNVNGKDVFSDPPSWTVTVPGTLTGAEAYVVAPIWSTNWYVNAASGDDANNGFTPATAKRTLAAILSSANVIAGDCVHAAPGVYAEGQMAQQYAARSASAMTTPVRVCVKAGVTLVGDAGAEKTVIKGERNGATFEQVTSGMRCVNLDHGASVVGFTLTGGSTPYVNGSKEAEPYLGGGVIGPVPWYGSRLPMIRDCIVSNNWACRGGGAFGAALVNCKVFENYATEDGTAAMATTLVNCLVDRNYSEMEAGEAVVRYPGNIVNCTITDRNVVRGNPSVKTKCHIKSWGEGCIGKQPIENTVIMGCLQENVAHDLRRCVLNADAAELGKQDAWTDGTVTKTVAEMKFVEGTYEPAADSPLVDAGNNGYVDSSWSGDRTLDGVERILCETVDIGAREYDYGRDIAAALGVSRPMLTWISPEVKLTNAGRVRLDPGAGLRIDTTSVRTKLRFAASATGTNGLDDMTILADGTSVPAEPGAASADFRFHPGSELAFSFADLSDGHGEIGSFTYNQGLMLIAW